MTALLLIAAACALANLLPLAVRLVLAMSSAGQRADRRHRPPTLSALPRPLDVPRAVIPLTERTTA